MHRAPDILLHASRANVITCALKLPFTRQISREAQPAAHPSVTADNVAHTTLAPVTDRISTPHQTDTCKA